MSEDIYLLKLPWGKPTALASDKRTCLATGTLDNDPDGLYMERLFEVPDEIGTEISFIDDPALGQASFLLLADGLEDVLLRTDHRNVGALTADLDAGDGTAQTSITSGALTGTLLYVGTEAVYFGSHVAGGEYNITRALFGTIAQNHPKGRSLFPHMHARYRALVQLYRVPRGGTYNDEVLVGSYILTDVHEGLADEIELECESLLAFLLNASICRTLWRGVSNNSAGDNRLNGFYASSDAPDPESPRIVPRPAAGIVGGEQKMLVSVDGDLALPGTWVELSSGEIRFNWNSVEDGPPLNLDADLEEEIPDGTPVWEFFVFGEDQPATADPATDTSLPLSANPIRVIQQFLTTTASPGANGPWDVGVETLGLKLPLQAMDLDSWDRLAERFSAYRVSRQALARDGKPVKLVEIAHKLWRVLGIAFTLNNHKIGVVEWRDVLEYGESAHLLQPGFLEIPHKSNNEPVRYATIEVEAGGYMGQPDVPVRIRAHDDEGTAHDADEADLGFDASAYDDPLAVASEDGLAALERYRVSPPIIETGKTDGRVNVSPGQVLEITHQKIRSTTGTLAISAFPCIVMGNTFHAWSRKVSYLVVMAGKGIDRYAHIAPSMKVVASDGATDGTTKVSVYRRHGQDGDDPLLDPDSFGFLPTHPVLVADEFHDPKYTVGLTITAIFGGQDLGGDPDPTTDLLHIDGLTGTAIEPGDYIAHADYVQAPSEVKETFAFLANDANPAKVAADEAYEYVG